MISFVKKPNPQPSSEEAKPDGLDDARKAMAERYRKSDTDGTRRRARQSAENNRLI